MNNSYDLTQLDEHSFEHLVNSLAIRVLGAGHTGFSPGADGGRDGYFEGTAPYPSESDQWTGVWYIQSKFHKPHLSTDSQRWLLTQIKNELKKFNSPEFRRRWPDIWIVATNVDPSGKPETGAFDKAKQLVEAENPELAQRFHIWGGNKILDYLSANEEIARRYGHFLTPGHVLSKMHDYFTDSRAEIKEILRYLIVKQFEEQLHTKLEQAGSGEDTRPGIHQLFIDLPFKVGESGPTGLVMQSLARSSATNHQFVKFSKGSREREWESWNKHPSRARVWFVKGGPGRGKSTIGQFFSQIQRAALILQPEGPDVLPTVSKSAEEVKEIALRADYWPTVPRIPINIELKDYAQWLGRQSYSESKGVLTYLSQKIRARVEQQVQVGTLKRALQAQSWLVIFDGLDEVPQDVKDNVATEVQHFVNDIYVENKIDLLTICTSRPQGYSGQFSNLEAAMVTLTKLSPEQALSCAKPVLSIGRSAEESEKSFEMLKAAIESPSVKEIMPTPLQSHIMAVVVRDGSRPPDRKWQLYNNFYGVIKRREANRNLPDKKLAKLLREDEQLLKAVHNRLGFVLHARAETSEGAQTSLSREEFKELVEQTVTQMIETDVEDVVNTLMKATTERLVLVNTPDDGDHVRYDIRPLQEFFAAEFIYESVSAERLRERVEVIAGDAHWREVMHFLLSALIENQRQTELSVVISTLNDLDEEGETQELKTLSRSLARGALLTQRLLQEGVLEQDKRVRPHYGDKSLRQWLRLMGAGELPARMAERKASRPRLK